MNVPVFCCVKTQEPLADRDTAALLSLLLCLALPVASFPDSGEASSLPRALGGRGWESRREEKGERRGPG